MLEKKLGNKATSKILTIGGSLLFLGETETDKAHTEKATVERSGTSRRLNQNQKREKARKETSTNKREPAKSGVKLRIDDEATQSKQTSKEQVEKNQLKRMRRNMM